MKKKKYLSQVQFIALGFLVMILIGTLLLMLPISSRTGESTKFLSALFTATSASCVTGLVVVDTSTHWSVFGQIIIIILIQIGGLGFISIGVFFSIILRRKIGLRERGLIMESINSLKIGGVVKLTRMILIGTAFFEFSGALILSTRFIPEYGWIKGIWFSIFHSISAFCNAGFDLMGAKYGVYSSLVGYYDDWVINIVIMLLIIIGGLGFVVWSDLYEKKWNIQQYRLHTKIVLTMTLLLVFGGGVLFYFTEREGLIKDMSISGQILSSLFSSVTARTAGFNTIDTAGLSMAGKLLTIILMFIGGSPGSTAGGVKTTTVFVMLANARASIKRTVGINAFHRRIENEAVHSVSTIATINLGLALLAGLIILMIQPLPMEDILFEVFSAMGTVGMTTGVTRELGTLSRMVMILLMYIGRVGSMSFALAFTQNKVSAPLLQPKEGISIG